MRMCSFCNKVVPMGTGKIYIKKTGKQEIFCSSKCEKNQKLGRSPRKLKWITKSIS